MTSQFIRNQIQKAYYQKKSGTATSYYRQSGATILPDRLSIDFTHMITSATYKGRMLLEKVIGEIRAAFKKSESSPLKQNKPYKVTSKIFQKPEFPQLSGYGTIAISDANGHITKESEEGVVVFNRIDEYTLQIYYMPGKCTPDFILSVCEYVAADIKNGEAFNLPKLDSKNDH